MKLVKNERELEFIYDPYHGDVDWLVKELDNYEEELVQVAGTFYLSKDNLKTKKKRKFNI